MKDVYKPEVAVFAAGCFWGVQYYFDQVPGVTKTVVGYTGGRTKYPTYEQVCTTDTGHAEAVYIEYNPHVISYKTLLKQFFRMHDPTQVDRQGPDIGSQYRSAIFYQTDEQKRLAEAVKAELQQKFKKPIATRMAVGREFWLAEDYHQKFTERTGRGMCHIPYAPV